MAAAMFGVAGGGIRGRLQDNRPLWPLFFGIGRAPKVPYPLPRATTATAMTGTRGGGTGSETTAEGPPPVVRLGGQRGVCSMIYETAVRPSFVISRRDRPSVASIPRRPSDHPSVLRVSSFNI